MLQNPKRWTLYAWLFVSGVILALSYEMFFSAAARAPEEFETAGVLRGEIRPPDRASGSASAINTKPTLSQLFSHVLRVPNAALRFHPSLAAEDAAKEAVLAGYANGQSGSPSSSAHAPTVYVVGAAGRPEPKVVRVGRTDASYTEVLSGLSVFDRVIIRARTASPQPR